MADELQRNLPEYLVNTEKCSYIYDDPKFNDS